ncbi:MAG TPA: preprotein translocase subunit YajC [Thermoanaerobacterales bacterium]|nr:preprotein translocase subunit YajC [Thermoanaerobacterales bacterium]
MDTALFLNQFGPIIFIFAIFYFLIIRPQQKRDKDRRNMLSNLSEGDDVVTIGGIYGRILNIKEDVITLDVGDKIKIKVTRSAIGNVSKKAEEKDD